MAVPTLSDGIQRAIEVIAVPSVVIIGLVGTTKVFYDAQTAGLVYIGALGLVLLGIYASAKYWNIKYTLGFAGTGLALWVGVPGIMPELVPTLFANIGKIIVLIFILLVGVRIADKM